MKLATKLFRKWLSKRRQRRGSRELQRLVDQALHAACTRDYAEHREAGLKGHRRRKQHAA